jgi:hypothetical protein
MADTMTSQNIDLSSWDNLYKLQGKPILLLFYLPVNQKYYRM